MPGVTVGARALKRRYGYGETIDLEVHVTNGTARRIYVVTDPYLWRSAPDRVEVRLAEAQPSPGFGYYNYLPPPVRGVPAGQAAAIPVAIGMPPREGVVDARGVYSWQEDAVAGGVTLNVTVGYLPRPFRPLTSAPWAEFLELQQLARPRQVKVHIEPR